MIKTYITNLWEEFTKRGTDDFIKDIESAVDIAIEETSNTCRYSYKAYLIERLEANLNEFKLTPNSNDPQLNMGICIEAQATIDMIKGM